MRRREEGGDECDKEREGRHCRGGGETEREAAYLVKAKG